MSDIILAEDTSYDVNKKSENQNYETLDFSDSVVELEDLTKALSIHERKVIELNPLKIDVILECLMSVLPRNSLLDARLVSTQWFTHVAPQLRSRHKTIVLYQMKSFNVDMKTTLGFPFGKFMFNDFEEEAFKLVSNFGRYLTNLCISSHKFSIRELRHVLKMCKNLEYFSFKLNPFYSDENVITADTQGNQMQSLKTIHLSSRRRSFEQCNNQLLENFFQLLPNLKEIQLDRWQPDFGKSALLKLPSDSLQKLYITSQISEDEIKEIQDCTFRLKTLKFDHLFINSDVRPLNKFLETHRESLIELWMETISVDEDINPEGPTYQFCFPVMPNLKTFGMEDNNSTLYSRNLIDIPLNPISSIFPALQKLQVYEQYLYEWDSLEVTATVQELAIRLECYYIDQSLNWNEPKSMQRLYDIFPNIQSFTLHSANSEWLRMVLLHSLDLKEFSLEFGYFGDLDSVLTGIPQVHCTSFAEGGDLLIDDLAVEVYLRLKTEPGICDMKNLRKFKIHLAEYNLQDLFNETENTDPKPMSDATIYLGLLQMKSLDTLELHRSNSNCQFSDDAVAELFSHHRKVNIT